MEHLWAPWRTGYIQKISKHSMMRCVFCKILKERRDKFNFIVERAQHNFSVLNIYPYNNGHTLVMPCRHVSDLSHLRKDEKAELFELLESTQALLKKVLKPEGYNVGVNLGRVAGAGFPGHIHFHIVPRWTGDMNFMPVVANTKVMSQSLKVLWQRLSDANKKKY